MTSAMWPDNAVEPSGAANSSYFHFEVHISRKVIHKKRSFASKNHALYRFSSANKSCESLPRCAANCRQPLCRHALRTDISLKALGLPQRPVPFPKHLQVPPDCRPAVRKRENTIRSRWSWKQRPLQASLQASTRSSPPRPLQVVICTSLRGRSPIGRDTQSREAPASEPTCFRCPPRMFDV